MSPDPLPPGESPVHSTPILKHLPTPLCINVVLATATTKRVKCWRWIAVRLCSCYCVTIIEVCTCMACYVWVLIVVLTILNVQQCSHCKGVYHCNTCLPNVLGLTEHAMDKIMLIHKTVTCRLSAVPFHLIQMLPQVVVMHTMYLVL